MGSAYPMQSILTQPSSQLLTANVILALTLSLFAEVLSPDDELINADLHSPQPHT